VITAGGVEGSLIYALSAALREQINRRGHAVLELDLLPDKSADRVLSEVSAGAVHALYRIICRNEARARCIENRLTA
jgi:predicted flavoprotein YhiN